MSGRKHSGTLVPISPVGDLKAGQALLPIPACDSLSLKRGVLGRKWGIFFMSFEWAPLDDFHS